MKKKYYKYLIEELHAHMISPEFKEKLRRQWADDLIQEVLTIAGCEQLEEHHDYTN